MSRYRRPRVVVLISIAVVAVAALTSGISAGTVPRVTAPSRTLLAARPSACPRMEAPIKVAAGVTSLASGDGSLWVPGFGAVSRVDPASGRVIAKIRTPGSDDYSQIAIGQHGVWVTSTGRGVVYRIAPSSDRVTATIHLRGPAQGVAVGGGRIWVTVDLSGPGRLVAIDPRTDRVNGPAVKVGPGPGEVVYGQHAVWVQNTSPASVMRINPTSRRVKTVIGTAPVSPGSPSAGAIAVGDGSLWSVAHGILTRRAPSSGHVIASIAVPRGVAITLGDHEVWVLSYPRSRSSALFEPIRHTAAVREIDPHTDRAIGAPIRLLARQPVALTVTHHSLWIANYSDTITRVRLVACRTQSTRARRAARSTSGAALPHAGAVHRRGVARNGRRRPCLPAGHGKPPQRAPAIV